MTEIQKHDPFMAMRIGEYRNLMVGRFLFVVGLRMMGTLVGWWIYNLTNLPFAIGLIGLSEVIPAVSLALYAGHIIDISEKRKLLLTGVLIYGILCFCLWLLSTPYSSAKLSNQSIANCIYIIIFFTGVARSFTGPLFNVMIGNIVKDKRMIQNATTWSQSMWLSASVLGHAGAGILIAVIGNQNTLTVICSLIAIAFIIFFQIKTKPALNEPGDKRTWESVKEGIAFVFKTKELLGALTLDLFAVFFGGAVAMVPVYARDYLKVGAEGFGFLNSASDIGSILIVVMLTIFPLRRKQGLKLLFSVAGFGICIIVFGISTLFWVSFAALLLSGILDGISVVIRGTIMQLKTPENMRGRVMSVNSMFINSSNELGQFESGFAAKLMNVIPSVVFGGCMTLFVVGVSWFKLPAMKKMEY